jgi:hypothetical protein
MVFKGGILGQELQQGSHNLRDEHEPNVVLRHKHVHMDASGRQNACPLLGPKATGAARAAGSTEAHHLQLRISDSGRMRCECLL